MVTQLQQSAAVYRAIWKQKVLVSRASGFNDKRLPAAKNGVEQGKKIRVERGYELPRWRRRLNA
jgi:hypothetical protein